MPTNQPRSQENHYGGTKRHHPEHDAHIEENFTPDNEDFQPNSAQYNDRQEIKFNEDDRLAAEHHDRPEPHHTEGEYKPSNYSEGGHGRPMTAQKREDNADNKDYSLNKDAAGGAKQKYQDSTEKHSNEKELP